jgi:hypothetical protein
MKILEHLTSLTLTNFDGTEPISPVSPGIEHQEQISEEK